MCLINVLMGFDGFVLPSSVIAIGCALSMTLAKRTCSQLEEPLFADIMWKVNINVFLDVLILQLF